MDPLAAVVARHAGAFWSDTLVPRLTVVRVDEPPGTLDMVYEPMVCFVASGSKRTTAGERSWVATAGQMFLSSHDLPVAAQFEGVPYRSAVLRLDVDVLAGLLLELGDTATAEAPAEAVCVAPMAPELVEAVTRWVRLLDAPTDVPALAGRFEAEVLYRLLTSPLGPALRQSVVAGSAVARVRAATGWLRSNYSRPVRVEELAAVAHMSVATLHRRFRAATGMSPLEFQRRLRLQEARRLLVAGGSTAAAVAGAVGYSSATQFSREYRRAYGLPPAADAARLREQLLRAG
nr:AraC family transcriptional regulator [Motilibacter aurantiacus]